MIARLKSLVDSPAIVSKVESFDMEAGLVIVTLVLEALLSSARKRILWLKIQWLDTASMFFASEHGKCSAE